MITRSKFAAAIAFAFALAVIGAPKAQASILTGTLQYSLQNVTLSGGVCAVGDTYDHCTTVNSTGAITTQATGTGDFVDVLVNTAMSTSPLVYDPPSASVTPFLSFTDPSAGQVDFFITAFTLTGGIFQNGILVLSGDGFGYFSNGGDQTAGHFSFASTRTTSTNPSGVSYAGGGTLEALGVPRDTTVPEPTSMILLGTGLVGLGARLRRRQKKA